MPAAHKPATAAKPPAPRPHFSRPAAHSRDRKPAQSSSVAAPPAVQAQRPEVPLRGLQQGAQPMVLAQPLARAGIPMEPSLRTASVPAHAPPPARLTVPAAMEMEALTAARPRFQMEFATASPRRRQSASAMGMAMGIAAQSRRQSPAQPYAALASCAKPTPLGPTPLVKTRGQMRARLAAAASPLSRLAPRPVTKNGMALLPRREKAPRGVQRSADDG